MFLKGRGKLSHLNGNRPSKQDPKFEVWDKDDLMVMSWLWKTMILKISDTCVFLSRKSRIMFMRLIQ
uniref:Uncharacterized protein n=1 Tax=Rhizophora mucronata TaxID=61149 RepID=A0A2P2JGL9_RHIMU